MLNACQASFTQILQCAHLNVDISQITEHTNTVFSLLYPMVEANRKRVNANNMYRNNSLNGLQKKCFTPAELSHRSNIDFGFLAKLIEHKVIVADGPCANLYSMAQLARLKQVCRLTNHVELEVSTLVRALNLLERIEHLEKRLDWLQLVMLDDQNSIIH